MLQTDNRAYWQYLRRVAPLLFEFEELTGPWPDAPQGRTRREIYARQHKLTIFRGQGRPRPNLRPSGSPRSSAGSRPRFRRLRPLADRPIAVSVQTT